MVTRVDILLVDDEARNLDALESILADPSYRLLRAQDAESALRLLLDNQVAAIVLDIKMPGVSGVELARMIKNTKRFRETPIVFLTAYMVDDSDVIAGYGAGGVDYLTKPVNPVVLRHKVAVFADLYRKTRELAEVNERLAELNAKLEDRVKERTAELEESEAALRAADRQKDEFIAILAHELRNPLAPLRTGLDLLVRLSAAPPPPVARTLAAMDRQLDHIVRLIDDLLDVSRISRGLLELKRDRVDVAAVVAAAVDNIRPLFDKRSQTVSVEGPDELVAYADHTRIAQVATNLLHNAAKFTPVGGSIRVVLTSHGQRAVLRVTDSGVGILADQLGRIFDMFVRIERPSLSTDRGLGIGLALARRLAEMHGGTLAAASAGDGRGATFTLEIPLEAPPERAITAGTNTVPAGNQAKLLDVAIVEDNEDVSQSLTDLLESLGHRVSTAATGRQGIELIRKSRPHLVLCDLGLPELDGLDVCRQIREMPADAQPVMVALTGWGRDDDLRRTKEAGFDHHLVKPISVHALQSILNAIEDARSGATPPSSPQS
jgi:signal transduction histidine kinase